MLKTTTPTNPDFLGIIAAAHLTTRPPMGDSRGQEAYPGLDNSEAAANNLIGVIDESGDDYLYPARLFQRITLPADLRRALRLAS